MHAQACTVSDGASIPDEESPAWSATRWFGAAPAPGAQQRLRGARPAVAERGAGAKRRRRGGEKGLWNSYPLEEVPHRLVFAIAVIIWEGQPVFVKDTNKAGIAAFIRAGGQPTVITGG